MKNLKKKRKKARVSRGTRTSKRTRREKTPIKRPEVTTSSKNPSSKDDVVELDHLPTPPPQNDPQTQSGQEIEARIIGLDGPEN